MTEVSIGDAAGLAAAGRRVVVLDGVEIGLFHLDGEFFAYENLCPHLGGPACQGLLLPLTTEAVDGDGKSEGRVFSATRRNVICPWHGMEFDIRTGEHPTDRRFRLRKVAVRRDGEDILVTIPDRRP
ncbi:MAG TPA: Rieske 2Fe-2S domain-containing protein [Hyphomicrobiales bacterium]|nr:Rieske 2Fe-2S domain-containing protein [Hyphomicrobiales bacterium]